jgi:hypothetical protein
MTRIILLVSRPASSVLCGLSKRQRTDARHKTTSAYPAITHDPESVFRNRAEPAFPARAGCRLRSARCADTRDAPKHFEPGAWGGDYAASLFGSRLFGALDRAYDTSGPKAKHLPKMRHALERANGRTTPGILRQWSRSQQQGVPASLGASCAKRSRATGMVIVPPLLLDASLTRYGLPELMHGCRSGDGALACCCHQQGRPPFAGVTNPSEVLAIPCPGIPSHRGATRGARAGRGLDSTEISA